MVKIYQFGIHTNQTQIKCEKSLNFTLTITIDCFRVMMNKS